MGNLWFTSDHHFGHANILRFKDDDGNLIRPHFNTVEEMDDYMISMWNNYIKPGDKVYHLGDYAIGADSIRRIGNNLNGSKRLILGNHDQEVKLLTNYFRKILLWRIFKEEGFVLTHIPIKEAHFRHKVLLNVHGHIHQRDPSPGPYLNICVERTDYTPVHMDEIIFEVNKLR